MVEGSGQVLRPGRLGVTVFPSTLVGGSVGTKQVPGSNSAVNIRGVTSDEWRACGGVVGRRDRCSSILVVYPILWFARVALSCAPLTQGRQLKGGWTWHAAAIRN